MSATDDVFLRLGSTEAVLLAELLNGLDATEREDLEAVRLDLAEQLRKEPAKYLILSHRFQRNEWATLSRSAVEASSADEAMRKGAFYDHDETGPYVRAGVYAAVRTDLVDILPIKLDVGELTRWSA